jgi:hypothetical protein
LEKYRTQSGFFNISIPEDNICQAPAGNSRAMADGFIVFLDRNVASGVVTYASCPVVVIK